jgi:hypothetical protein
MYKLIVILTLFIAASVSAKSLTNKEFVESIESVNQVKVDILFALEDQHCMTASCINFNAGRICSLIGALDIHLDNEITSAHKTNFKPKLEISKSDLSLFKDLWTQCIPTNDQYWNYPTLLHVIYAPENDVYKTLLDQLKSSVKK